MYRRARQSKPFMTSIHALSLGSLIKTADMAILPSVWKALGTIYAGDVIPAAWTNLSGAALLAYVIHHYTPRPGALAASPQTLNVLTAGELLVTWMEGGAPPTIESIIQARGYVCTALRNCIIPYAEANRVFTTGLAMSRQNAGMMAGDSVRDRLNIPAAVQISDNVPVQKFYWIQNRMNMIPYAWTVDPNNTYLDFVNQMNNLNSDQAVNFDEVITLNNADWSANWSAATDEIRLAFIECWASIDNKMTRSVIFQSVVNGVIALLKGDAVTDAWLASRLPKLRSLAPDLDVESLVTEDFIKEFATRYPKDSLTVDFMYKTIQSLNASFAADRLDVMKWILEQGVVHNIATAVAFAEAVVKPSYVPFEKLFEILPLTQFAKLMELVMHLKRDRFAAIVRPPVTMAEYADLAYIGQYIVFMDRGDARHVRYAGNPLARATKTRQELTAIADTLLLHGTTLTKDHFSIVNLLKTHYVDDLIAEIGGDIYRIPGGRAGIIAGAAIQQAVGGVGGGAQGGAGAAGQAPNAAGMGAQAPAAAAAPNPNVPAFTQDQIDTILQAERVSWIGAAKALPPGAVKCDSTDIKNALVNVSPRAAAFKAFMEDLISLSQQTLIEEIPLSQITMTQRLKALSNEDVAKLNLWNVVIPADYIQPPAQINPQNSPEGDDTLFFMASRLDHINEVIQLGRAAAPNP